MSRVLAFVAISAVLAQVGSSQAIVPISSLFPNQFLLNSLPNFVSLAPNVLGCEETIVSTPIVKAPILQSPVIQTPCVQPIVQAPVVPTTTIIQDSSVANNLANALQLLIVSNLLSNTLPNMGEVVVPACAPTLDVFNPITQISPYSLGGLTYVY